MLVVLLLAMAALSVNGDGRFLIFNDSNCTALYDGIPLVIFNGTASNGACIPLAGTTRATAGYALEYANRPIVSGAPATHFKVECGTNGADNYWNFYVTGTCDNQVNDPFWRAWKGLDTSNGFSRCSIGEWDLYYQLEGGFNMCACAAIGTAGVVPNDTNGCPDNLQVGFGTSCAVKCGAGYEAGTATFSCAANANTGDAATGSLVCTEIKCAADQKVVSNACVACPAGKTNAANDTAAGSDTTCDDAASDTTTPTPTQATEEVRFPNMRFSDISNMTQFLVDCTAAYSARFTDARCTGARAGSVIISFAGPSSSMVAIMTHITSLPNIASGGVLFDSNGAEDYLHPQTSSSSDLSGGEIAGIVIGCLAVAAIFIAVVVGALYYFRASRLDSGDQGNPRSTGSQAPPGNAPATGRSTDSPSESRQSNALGQL